MQIEQQQKQRLPKNFADRVLLGFLLAPLFPCVFMAIITSLSVGRPMAIPLATLIYAIFSYPLAWLLGIPAFFFLRMKKKPTLPALLATAAGLGALGMLVLQWAFKGFPAPSFPSSDGCRNSYSYGWLIKATEIMAFGGAFGTGTALALWKLIFFNAPLQRTENNDRANKP